MPSTTPGEVYEYSLSLDPENVDTVTGLLLEDLDGNMFERQNSSWVLIDENDGRIDGNPFVKVSSGVIDAYDSHNSESLDASNFGEYFVA